MSKKVKNCCEKVCRLENKVYLCTPFEKRVAVKAGSSTERLTLKKKIKNFCKKVWRLKNKAYLCNPNEKGALTEGFNKFIEKTDLLYKKQVPRKYNLSRSVNFFGNYEVSVTS